MRRLGRYEIGPLLGTGGQGRVYQATLRGPGGLRKPVALKMLEGGEGLRREARLGGLLRHGNLVDVYEVGEVDGVWFIAMERCDGTLADHLPLPARAVVDVGLQVCEALAYAHSALGLVHLDLKPANLLFKEGRVKVADLGIAHAEGFARQPGARGTLDYMAPEQMRAGPVDARTDIYALGVVLRELATGRAGAAADTFSLDTRPRGRPSPAPDWLEPIVDRCTAHDPADRFPNMSEVSVALGALAVTGPSLADTLGFRGDPLPARVEDPALSPFVGRRDDVAGLDRAVARPGVVTLKGPGGIGKTRLARELMSTWTRGPTFFVDLSPARTVEGVSYLTARVLDVAMAGATPADIADRLGHALRAHDDVLLVLDNFEQVIDAASVLGRWRTLAPRARVLVTSRIPLQIDGEHVVDVGPLGETDAIALLVSRARDRGVDIAGDPALPGLARRLAGIPLALELAAGRMGVLSAGEVLERLSLSLLRSGDTGVPDRQATLAGALDWSWALLSDQEREALAQLSVFQTPFTAEAAEAVVLLPAGSKWIVDLLDALVDRSLLTASQGKVGFLEPIREFAASRLSDAGAPEARHGAWFAQFGTPAAKRALDGFGGLTLFRARAAELDDILLAYRRAVSRDDAETAALCALAASLVLYMRGPLAPGARLIDEVLPMAPAHRPRLLASRGTYRLLMHDPRGLADCRQARAMMSASGQHAAAAGMTYEIGTHLDNAGRRAEAIAVFRQGLEEARDGGFRTAEAVSLWSLGMAASGAGDGPTALTILSAALEVCDSEGFWRFRAPILDAQAKGYLLVGRHAEAHETALAALRHSRAIGAPELEVVLQVNLAAISLRMDRFERARSELEEARATAARQGARTAHATASRGLAQANRYNGEYLRSLALLDEVVDTWRELKATGRGVLAQVERARVLGALGRFDEARRAIDDAQRTVRRAGAPLPWLRIRMARARLALQEGQLDGAAAALEEAMRLVGDDARPARPVACHLLADLALRTGRCDTALRHLDEAEQHASVHLERVVAARLRGEVLVALGRTEEGRIHLDALSRRSLPAADRIEVLLARSRALGDRAAHEEARGLVDRLDLPRRAPLQRRLRGE